MFRSLVASAFAVFFTSSVFAADLAPLSEQDLRSLVPGSAIEIDTPLGTVVPVRFGTDGTMTGEAGKLASVLGSERDRGRWWVMSDQLCFKWFRWFDAERRCLKLSRDGNQIAWAQQGGDRDTGTATIVSLAEPLVAKPAAKIEEEVERANSPQPVVVAAPSIVREPPAPPSAALANLTIISRAEAATPFPGAPEPASENAAPTVEPVTKKSVAKTAVPLAKPKTNIPSPKSATGKASDTAKPTATKLGHPAAGTKFADPTYQVARVQDDDVLNIRSGPSEYHAAVGAIPPSGRGVKIVGECEDDWCPVVHGRAKGWVNSYYLTPEGPTDKKRATR